MEEFGDTYVRQATFYEGIGVLVELGLIDITRARIYTHENASHQKPARIMIRLNTSTIS
jgi:hypothetical protein